MAWFGLKLSNSIEDKKRAAQSDIDEEGKVVSICMSDSITQSPLPPNLIEVEEVEPPKSCA
jgi:hypothetical protein